MASETANLYLKMAVASNTFLTQSIGSATYMPLSGGTFTACVFLATTTPCVEPTAIVPRDYVDQIAGQNSLRYYFSQTDDPIIAGYEKFATAPEAIQTSDGPITVNAAITLLDTWITPANTPNITTLLSGIYEINQFFTKTGGGVDITYRYEMWTRNTVGTMTFVATSSSAILSGTITTPTIIRCILSVPAAVTIAATDRIVIRAYASRSGAATTTIWYGSITEGFLSFLISPRNFARTDFSNISASALSNAGIQPIASMSAYASSAIGINLQTGTYTLVLADAGKLLRMGGTSTALASVTTLILPASNTVPFPIGTFGSVCRAGVGEVRFAGAAGVTVSSIASPSGTPWLFFQYSDASWVYLGTDTYAVWGDIKNGL